MNAASVTRLRPPLSLPVAQKRRLEIIPRMLTRWRRGSTITSNKLQLLDRDRSP